MTEKARLVREMRQLVGELAFSDSMNPYVRKALRIAAIAVRLAPLDRRVQEEFAGALYDAGYCEVADEIREQAKGPYLIEGYIEPEQTPEPERRWGPSWLRLW